MVIKNERRFETLLAIMLVMMTGCQSATTSTPTNDTDETQNIYVKAVDPERTPGIFEDFPLPNCGGTEKLTQILGTQFSVKKNVEIGNTVSVGGGVEVGVSEIAKGSLEAAVEAAYKEQYESARTRLYTIEMGAAPHSYVVYTIEWEELVYSSEITFELNNDDVKAPYEFSMKVPKISESREEICQIETLTATDIAQPSMATETPVGAQYPFENGCIESKYWTPYTRNTDLRPSDEECLELMKLGIYAQNNELLFFNNDTNQTLTKGISTHVSPNTEISFTVLVSTPNKFSNPPSYIGFGIGDANTDPKYRKLKGTFLYYRIEESPGNTIEIGDWWGSFQNIPKQQYSFDDQAYDIFFSVEEINFSIFVNSELIGAGNLSSNQNFFWISYSVPPYGELPITISKFTIKSK